MVEEGGAQVRVESASVAGIAQRVEARSHVFIADEPDGAGSDEGPTPYELLLAALGTCTSMTVTMYARAKGIALEHVSVRLTYNREYVTDCINAEETKRRVHRIERDITLTGDLSDAELTRLVEIAELCAVHRTLEERSEIVTRLT